MNSPSASIHVSMLSISRSKVQNKRRASSPEKGRPCEVSVIALQRRHLVITAYPQRKCSNAWRYRKRRNLQMLASRSRLFLSGPVSLTQSSHSPHVSYVRWRLFCSSVFVRHFEPDSSQHRKLPNLSKYEAVYSILPIG